MMTKRRDVAKLESGNALCNSLNLLQTNIEITQPRALQRNKEFSVFADCCLCKSKEINVKEEN